MRKEEEAEPAGEMFDTDTYFPTVLPMSESAEAGVEEDPEHAHVPQELSLVRAAQFHRTS